MQNIHKTSIFLQKYVARRDDLNDWKIKITSRDCKIICAAVIRTTAAN